MKESCLWVKPKGLTNASVAVSDLMLVDAAGSIIQEGRNASFGCRFNPWLGPATR
jgi:hypothetical protein